MRWLVRLILANFMFSLPLCYDSALAQSDARSVRIFRPTGTGAPPVLPKDIPEIIRRAKQLETDGLFTAQQRIELEKTIRRAPDIAKLPPDLKLLLVMIPMPEALPDEIATLAQFLESNKGPRNEDVARWTSTAKLEFGDPLCSATLIGPRVMLTAAHCITPGEEVALAANGRQWRLECERHPSYADYGFRALFDYALCRTDGDFPIEIELDEHPRDRQLQRKVALLFERISLNARDALPLFRDVNSRWLLLLGYGCSDMQETKPDGKLRAGFARISMSSELRLITGSPWRDDSAIICAGDSGGAAYRVKSRDDPYGERTIIGVNSANVLGRHQSFLSKTSAPAFVRFFHTWRRRWGYPKVCGVDADIDVRCHP